MTGWLLDKSVAARAATQRGMTPLGSGAVEGTDAFDKHRNALLQAAIDHTRPPVRLRSRLVPCVNGTGRSDHLLVIDVEPSDIVHANNRDEVFLRVGDETRKLTFLQRQELLYDKGQAAYEATPVVGTAGADLRKSLLEQYAEALGHPDPARLATARGFANAHGELTVAGLLLFGEHPQQHLPTALVRVLLYRGVERGTGARQQLVEEVRWEGPIPEVVGVAHGAVRRLQPTRRALGRTGRFEPVGLVPKDAWLQGLVNAVVHRSYSIAGDHIRVEIFDDRIERPGSPTRATARPPPVFASRSLGSPWTEPSKRVFLHRLGTSYRPCGTPAGSARATWHRCCAYPGLSRSVDSTRFGTPA